MSDEEIIKQAIKILESRLREPEAYFRSSKDTNTFLKLHFNGLEHESFRIMFLDNQHGMIAIEEISRGTIDGAAIYPREVVKATLAFNAAAVIFAHNHPSGCTQPSQADIAITRRLQSALSTIDVRTLDHIIIGGSHTYSFAENHLIN